MAALGDLNQVRKMLRSSVITNLGQDADDRLARLQSAVTLMIEHRTGRVFGETEADTTHVVWAADSSVLLLPLPARSIASVTTGGVWNGSAYAGGTVMDTEHWEPYTIDPGGMIWSLRLVAGGWWGGVDRFNRPVVPVLVVGDFADSDDDAVVPDDVNYIAELIIAKTYQRENASPAGFTGFDTNAVEQPNDPWKDPMVVDTLARYSAGTRPVVF